MTRMERSYRQLGRLEDARKLHGEIQAIRDALKLSAEMQPVRVPMPDNPPPRSRTIRVTK